MWLVRNYYEHPASWQSQQLEKFSAWENGRHFSSPPLDSARDDVWESQDPWRIIAQIWLVLLIGWIKIFPRHDQSEALTWNFCAWNSSDTSRGIGFGFSKCRMFSQAKMYPATWREQWETNSPPRESNLPWRNWYTLCYYLPFRTTVIAGDNRSPQS